jgi:hypothetical protein
MALSIDGSANAVKDSSKLFASCSLTLPTAGDILVVVTVTETTTNPPPTIISFDAIPGVSAMHALLGSPLTVQYTGFSDYLSTEIWWGFCSGTLSGQAIKANFSAAVDTAVIGAFGVTGFVGTAYQTNPWDDTPVTATGGNPTATAPTATLNTTSAHTMVLGMTGADLSMSSTGSGFTRVLNQTDLGGTNECGVSVEEQVFTTPQTGLVVNWGQTERAWMHVAAALAELGHGGTISDVPAILIGL